MPTTRPIERKLTTILAADAANYSGRMNQDEEGTVRALRAARDVIDAAISNENGRIANTSGDGLIAEFPSVVSAVRCAIQIQSTLNLDNNMLPFRLGVHLDDVVVEGQDLLGDGVNLAARLQEMAQVGGILISQQVFDHVRGKIADTELRPMGPATPKHLTEIGLYAVVADGVKAPRLPDNLGPKVDPVSDVMATEPVATTATVELRAKFQKSRWRIGGAIVALAIADIIFGLAPGITLVPTLVLIWVLYRKWKKLRDAETAQA